MARYRMFVKSNRPSELHDEVDGAIAVPLQIAIGTQAWFAFCSDGLFSRHGWHCFHTSTVEDAEIGPSGNLFVKTRNSTYMLERIENEVELL